MDDAAHEVPALVERFALALNDRDGKRLSACFDVPLMAMRAPLGDETDMGEALSAITDPAAVLNLLPEHWGHSTVDSHVTLESVAAFPDRLADWEYRPAVITTWTRWDRNGRPYERVQALYMLTRRGGQLRIKFAAELAVAKLD